MKDIIVGFNVDNNFDTFDNDGIESNARLLIVVNTFFLSLCKCVIHSYHSQALMQFLQTIHLVLQFLCS